MKIIQPITAWLNGQEKQGVYFVISAFDNIKNSAKVSYCIYDVDMSVLVTGELIMDGVDYDNWTTNEYAYTWAADQLNLVIVGEVTTTTTTSTSTTIEPSTTTSTTTGTVEEQ
jgi:protein associated with RNAse G/E